MRFPRITTLSVSLVLLTLAALGQSPNGNINGLVLDPTNRVIAGAEIVAVNDVTGVQFTTKTNDEGVYVLVNLPPGPYRLQVSKVGFKTIVKPDIVVHLQDALALNFTLPVGASLEVVTVQGGSPLISTENATVSTVVDRKYVENMPLNGRSFQDLILLTPGIVTNNPQASARSGDFGEFSVNGQRTQSNTYSVDGVSMNLNAPTGSVLSAGNSGSLPALTVLGTTQGLVSVDALEEFRVQSSTYSAEYGRTPGGQFSFITRSGTNQFHGSAFDYLRNDIFDAGDWFNGRFGLRKPPLRQNDFGGTLGGPVNIPGTYNGKNRTFFFFSYEGLRLIQPQPASTSTVPSVSLRATAPASLQPALAAFPLPACPAVPTTPCTTDFGDGLGEFVGAWSNPSSIDAYSVRLDHFIGQKARLFFRFGETPSHQGIRAGGAFADPAVLQHISAQSRTYTLGLSTAGTGRWTNEFRLNYGSAHSSAFQQITAFHGSEAADLAQSHGLSAADYSVVVFMSFSNFADNASLVTGRTEGLQRQWNITDQSTLALGSHRLKLGVDLRRLTPVQSLGSPNVFYEYLSDASVNANSADFASAQSTIQARPSFLNFSAFADDTWQPSPRLNLSLGIRWEVNPAPGAAKGNLPYTIAGDIGAPASLSLAPRGTPLWRTSWYNFAPRLGGAYVLRNRAASETVLRGGVGIFFDTGQQEGTFGYNGAGFSGSASYFGAAYPLDPSQIAPPIVNPPVGPGLLAYGFEPHLQLPFTWQWNISLQQAMGQAQAFTVTYVGANGRRLLQTNQLNLAAVNPQIGTLIFIKNGLTSDYDALQAQFQRRLVHGLQALGSYTWGHAIDYGSQDGAFPYKRGNSNFDVRQSVSAALSYELPKEFHGAIARKLLNGWALDSRFAARTGFPVTLDGPRRINTATLQSYNAGLDLIGSQKVYSYGQQFPGGRRINPDAFALPAADQVGDAPRNFVRGFGAWQMDLAIRREFPLYEALKLQLRAEAFNVFNHPNFGTINSTLCASSDPLCTFGQATSTLAQSLGGLSPLYQLGGPRSLQFALKVIF